MGENKQEKKFLAAGSHISLAIDQRINKDTQGILNSLTSLSLAKAYYRCFNLDIMAVGVFIAIFNI